MFSLQLSVSDTHLPSPPLFWDGEPVGGDDKTHDNG